MIYVDLKEKFKAFPADWKLSWKYFEKYLKQVENVIGSAGISQRRQQILAFVKRSLNDAKIKVITKERIQKVEEILKEKAGENPFYVRATEYFIRFLKNFLR